MAKAKYSYQYTQTDFGIERHLTVFKDGQPIGTRDPFWTCGVKVGVLARKRQMLKVAREIIRDYEAREQKAHPDFWRVYEGAILRANQSTKEGALHYMKPGRVLVPPAGGAAHAQL